MVFYSKLPHRLAAEKLLRETIAGRKARPFVPRKVDKPLVLYGAGNLGRMAKEYFDRLGIPVACIVDKKVSFLCNSGIKIYAPDEIPIEQRESRMIAVCVATVPYSQIEDSLRDKGWNDIVPYYNITEAYTDRYPLHNGWSGKISDKDIEHIDAVMSQWKDDISRAHYLQFIAWHGLREEWIFKDAPVTTDNRYFIPEALAVLHDHEIFLDIGAYHGEVVTSFLAVVKNKYDKLYAIEPDFKNFRHLYANLQDKMLENDVKITLSMKALGSVADRLFYSGLGYASQFSELGQGKVDVMRLDDLSIPATFIKIHVEGWEGDVIRGGVETIKKNRPILAITSYHNCDGLWKLPAQIMGMLDNYTFYFRLHAWQGQSSVIYAIPRERNAKYDQKSKI